MQLRSRLFLATSQAQTAGGYLKSFNRCTYGKNLRLHWVFRPRLSSSNYQAMFMLDLAGGKNSNSCQVKNDEKALSSILATCWVETTRPQVTKFPQRWNWRVGTKTKLHQINLGCGSNWPLNMTHISHFQRRDHINDLQSAVCEQFLFNHSVWRQMAGTGNTIQKNIITYKM